MTVLKLREYVVCFLLLSCFNTTAFAQSSEKVFTCHDAFSQAEIEEFMQMVADGTSNRNARVGFTQYRVAVKATVFHESSVADQKFTTDDVRLLIAHANAYFKQINVELYLQSDNVNHVSDQNYVNFKVTQDAELRAKYDVTNAINLYLFKTISTEDGVFLNGSAALPNLSNNSNRIFLSYLDRNKEDFETLKNKVFPHELGHYFGLFHTFQNSNNTDVSKRELVSRDIGSIGNCNVAGDYLCDTPADPFERLVSISSFNCNERLPADLVDALGYTYSPPTDNIMSYQVRCGNVFTPGQYQRMEQSFTIRFSPNASYNILGNQANYLLVSSLSASEICEGETIRVKFITRGDFGRIDNFTLQLSDSSGENFVDMPAARISGTNEFSLKLDNINQTSSNYRFRVVSKVPYLESTVSEQFTIHTKGELTLSLSDQVIRPGGTSTLALDFSGSGPWEVVFNNGITLFAINNRNHRIRIRPLATNTYQVTSANGRCGAVAIKNNVTLTIAEPAIVIQPEFAKRSCQDTFFQIPVTGVRNSAGNASYKVLLTNADTTMVLQSSVASNVIFGLAPRYNSNSTNEYQLTIEGNEIAEYSFPVTFKVFPRAALPLSESTVSYCFNSSAKPLIATGRQLKWYLGQNDLLAREQIIPPTRQAGVSYYYVTQTNEFGCESARQEVKVVVKSPATAEISGDNTIKFGDKTALTVKLRGEAPWNFELSDGQRFETTKAEIFPEVQPDQSKIYTLSKALNTCGEVFLTGSANITVLQPLSLRNEYVSELRVFPNPVGDVLSVEIQEANFASFPLLLKLVDMLGRIIIEQYVERDEVQDSLLMNVTDIPTGLYLLQLSNKNKKYQRRIVISH